MGLTDRSMLRDWGEDTESEFNSEYTPFESYKENHVYMITTFTKAEVDELGWPDLGSSNFIGWFSTERRAREFVINNECDIWETIYDYALIEEWCEGYGGYTLDAYWYKYNREIDKYEPILAPECTKNFCGFTNPWGK